MASFKSAVSHASTVMLVFCTISNTLNRQSLEFHDNTAVWHVWILQCGNHATGLANCVVISAC